MDILTQPDAALQALREISGNPNLSYSSFGTGVPSSLQDQVDQGEALMREGIENVAAPSTSNMTPSTNTSWWDKFNFFGGSSNTVPFGDDWIRSKGFDPVGMDPTLRADLFNMYNHEQQYGLAQDALGWGKIGTMAQLGGAIIKPFFDYQNYRLAKDNLNYMKKQGERNWRATVTNYNDRANMLNWNGSSFNGGASRPWYQKIK